MIESTAHKHENGYLIWTSSLGMGERLNALVKYNLDVFTTNENEQYTEKSGNNIEAGATMLIIIVAVVLVLLFIFFISDDYDSGSGFGGGRAGCSKKDFYGTNLRTEELRKVLKK